MDIVVEFENWLIEDGKVEKTLESYVGDIKAFVKWLDGKKIDFHVVQHF